MDKNIFIKEFKAIGTDISIQIVADLDEKERIDEAFLAVEKIYQKENMILSRFTPESEISKLNAKLNVFNEASEGIIHLAESSLKYYSKSEGFFDPRILDSLEKNGYREDFKKNDFKERGQVEAEIFKKELREDLKIDGNKVMFGERMDFTGIAKGYINDRVVGFLEKGVWKNFLVDSGGDMYAKGKNGRDEAWGIALEGAKDENEVMMEISNQGLATSGNTRRSWEMGGEKVHHLINPKNINKFDFDLRSVTARAIATEEADFLAKVLFLMGLEKGMVWAKNNKVSCIFLKNNQEIFKVNL